MTSSIYHISLWVLSLVALSAQQDTITNITCYGFTGREFSGNSQCPGSDVCCADVSQCLNDRLCEAKGQLVVPACAVFPWSDCSNICQYDPGTGLLPRALNCSDGSFCCDNDPTCCAENRGTVLNGLGAIVSTDPGLTSTTSSSTTTSTTTTTTTSSSLAPTSTIVSSTIQSGTLASATSSQTSAPHIDASHSGLSSGAKAGIGIAVALCLAGFAVMGFFIWSYKRRVRKLKPAANAYRQYELTEPEPFIRPLWPAELEPNESNPTDMAKTRNAYAYDQSSKEHHVRGPQSQIYEL